LTRSIPSRPREKARSCRAKSRKNAANTPLSRRIGFENIFQTTSFTTVEVSEDLDTSQGTDDVERQHRHLQPTSSIQSAHPFPPRYKAGLVGLAFGYHMVFTSLQKTRLLTICELALGVSVGLRSALPSGLGFSQRLSLLRRSRVAIFAVCGKGG